MALSDTQCGTDPGSDPGLCAAAGGVFIDNSTWHKDVPLEVRCCGNTPSDFGLIAFCGAQPGMGGAGYDCGGDYLCVGRTVNASGPSQPAVLKGTENAGKIIHSIDANADFVSTGHSWVKCTPRDAGDNPSNYYLYLFGTGGLRVGTGMKVNVGGHDYLCTEDFTFAECCGPSLDSCLSGPSDDEGGNGLPYYGGAHLTSDSGPISVGSDDFQCNTDGRFSTADYVLKSSPGTCEQSRCRENQCYAAPDENFSSMDFANRLPNGGFEAWDSGHPTLWYSAASLARVSDRRPGARISDSVAVKVTAGTTAELVKNSQKSYARITSGQFPVTPGASYTGSVWVRLISPRKATILASFSQYTNDQETAKLVSPDDYWRYDTYTNVSISSGDGWVEVSLPNATVDLNGTSATVSIMTATKNALFELDDAAVKPTAGCLSQGDYSNDRYCSTGVWTTRTREIAREILLSIPQETNFTLFCDDPLKSLNYYTYLETDESRDYFAAKCFNGASGPCFNNFCVLRFTENGNPVTAVGGSVNFMPTADDFTRIFGEPCYPRDNFSDSYFQCSANKTLWFDPGKKTFVFSTSSINVATGSPAQQSFLNSILAYMRGLLSKILSYLTGQKQARFSYVVDLSSVGNRLFILESSNMSVFGRLEEKCNGSSMSRVLAVDYRNTSSGTNSELRDYFNDTLSGACNSFYPGLWCYSRPGGIFAIGDDKSAADSAALFDGAWSDMTAKLRIGESP